MDNPNSNTKDSEIEKFSDDDGVELMIPLHIDDFLARLVEELIYANIDISREYVLLTLFVFFF
jgi:hypothetical protein